MMRKVIFGILSLLILTMGAATSEAELVEAQVAAGAFHTIGLKTDGTVVAVGDNSKSQCNAYVLTDIKQLTAAERHTIGLKTDGTVQAVGENGYGQLNVSSWTDIKQVSTGVNHTIGLKTDGSLVAVGSNSEGQCDVSSWTDIKQIFAGMFHTIGIKTDGTVIVVGRLFENQSTISSWTDIKQVAEGWGHIIGLKTDGTVIAVGDNSNGQCDVSSWADMKQVAAGKVHTIGLKTDGTVVAVGSNHSGQCDVSSWTDIKQVAAGYDHTIGLKTDGTVVVAGNNDYGQCDVAPWPDIKQVTAGGNHALGLKTDGTVRAAGENNFGQCDVASWTDMKQAAAGYIHTIGLNTDGTVVAVGYNAQGQCDVTSWTDIKQVAAGYSHTIGLKIDGTVVNAGDTYYNDVSSWINIQQVAVGTARTIGLKTDGTVVAIGDTYYCQCDMSSWTDIKQVAVGGDHTIGLKTDGTVVAVGNNESGQCDVASWTDIKQVAAGYSLSIGLKTDGTVVAVGDNYNDQCNVSSWTNIKEVAVGSSYTIGLKNDGSIIAVGNKNNESSKYNVASWKLTNTSPNTPAVPSPADNSTDIPLNTELYWIGGDPDADNTMAYDTYFGTDNPPLTLVSEDQSGTTLNAGPLEYGTTYYWQIISKDNHGAQTQGPVWQFKTKDNLPPVITQGESILIHISEDNNPVAFELTLNAINAGADTLWSVKTQANHGIAQVSGTGISKSIYYSPEKNYNGADTFEVQVSDGLAVGVDTIVVTVAIESISDLTGDLDGDFKITFEDVVLSLKVLTNQESAVRQGYIASGIDVNGDNKIGLAEAIYPLQVVPDVSDDMSNASLSGTYVMTTFGGGQDPDGNGSGPVLDVWTDYVSLSFDGNGSGEIIEVSGVSETILFTYSVNSDGKFTIEIPDSTGTGIVSSDGNHFTFTDKGSDENTFDEVHYTGIKKSSGMSNASLGGTYVMTTFGGGQDPNGNGSGPVLDVWTDCVTLSFDGNGNGEIIEVSGVSESFTFTYAVNYDGKFTIGIAGSTGTGIVSSDGNHFTFTDKGQDENTFDEVHYTGIKKL
ncbi:MAG: Ig-like domain-containing protein [Desulfobacula sp.]|jgi:alpha-tubulin suppressor-like RCC1 family protein|nr:Ig-like domain-containing protein [Desulfobacula sp.]